MRRSSATDGRRPRPAGPGSPRWLPYAFLAPGLLLYTLFALVPIGRAGVLSLYHWDGLGPSTFAGLDNYRTVLTDERLREAFGHAAVLVVFFSLLPVGLGLVLAAVLHRRRGRGGRAVRTVVFLPQVIAMVVVAVAWRRIYAPDGDLNRALRALGLDGLTRAWLGDHAVALPAVGLVGTWVSLGLVTVLLGAGMTRIPAERFEAARLDGAGPLRELVSITVPALRGEIAVALTLTVIAALKTFDLVYVMTGGGPGHATTVPSYEVYREAFVVGRVGLAAALGLVLMLLILAVNLLVTRVAERDS